MQHLLLMQVAEVGVMQRKKSGVEFRMTETVDQSAELLHLEGHPP
jgi:hypothetical protein